MPLGITTQQQVNMPSLDMVQHHLLSSTQAHLVLPRSLEQEAVEVNGAEAEQYLMVRTTFKHLAVVLNNGICPIPLQILR